MLTIARATQFVRIFLGLFLLANGLNFWFNFLPLSSPPSDLANKLMSALVASGLFEIVKYVEIGAGICLLSDRYVPLSLIAMTPLSIIIFWLDFIVIGTFETVTYGILLLIPQLWMMMGYLSIYSRLFRKNNIHSFTIMNI